MSDSAPLPVEAPTSTAEIASQVIESAEHADTGSDTGGDDGTGDGTTVAAATETATPVVEKVAPTVDMEELIAGTPRKELEALLAEFGFKDLKKPDGRDHYIPRPKVLNMIATGLKRGQEKWTAERGVVESQAQELRQYVEEIRTDVLGDETAFITKLAQADPRYRRFLEPQAQASAQAAGGEMPGPDMDLGNGSKTYSVDGIQKLIEWAVDARMLPKVDERLKPWQDREQRAKQAEAQQELQTRTRSQMDTAKAWPQWTDYEGDVLKRLQQDSSEAKQRGERPKMTLREAYLEVRAERLTTDHNTVRERVIAELKGAPTAPALSRQTADGGRQPGPATTADITRQTIARLERGGA